MRALSFAINSKGDNTRWVVPSDQGVLRRRVAAGGLGSDRAAPTPPDLRLRYAWPHAKKSPERKNITVCCAGLRRDRIVDAAPGDLPAVPSPTAANENAGIASVYRDAEGNFNFKKDFTLQRR